MYFVLKMSKTNMGIGQLPIQHSQSWPYFDDFVKTPEQFILILIYNTFI